MVLAQVVRPHLHAIVSEAQRTFRVTSAQLMRAQVQALVSLGRDFDTDGYCEARLPAIRAHLAANISLPTYLALQNTWAQGIIARIPDDLPRAELTSFVLRITGLDQAIAAQAYEVEHLGSLKRRLDDARASQRKLRRLARTDSLTGLVNRASIDAHLERAVDAATRSQHPLSVIAVDIDRFKSVNDEHGHAAGDQVLRAVTRRMESALRDGDWLGRYGGEEFLVVLQNTDVAGANEIAERLRARVGADAIDVEGAKFRLTISLGVAALTPKETAHELVARADGALYDAKRSGRDRVAVRDTHRAFERAG